MAIELAVAILPNGKSLVFEQDVPTGSVYPVGISDLSGKIDFNVVTETVREATGQLIEEFQKLTVAPDACEIIFGIKLNATAGVILAKAGSEANFSIKLTWSKKKA
jgi:hypothetical protein